MKINISSSRKNVPVESVESGKAYVVAIDPAKADYYGIQGDMRKVWDNSVTVAYRDVGAARMSLIRVGGGEFHDMSVGSMLSKSIILTEIKELNVVI